MALSKSAVAVYSGQSLAAGGGPTTSASQALNDAYEALVHVKLTNGATGPTTAPQVQIQVSPDDSEWYDLGGPLVGSTANAAVVSWGGIQLPLGTRYVRFVITHPTGQNVTLEVDLTKVTGV